MEEPIMRTGYLAVACPDCGGSGEVTWRQGMEQLRYSAQCATCNGVGYIVDLDTKAVSVEDVTEAVKALCENFPVQEAESYFVARTPEDAARERGWKSACWRIIRFVKGES